ncbi:MAG: acyl-CoA thioesterase domain-containing protein [Actinomycetota bacterium]
MTDASGAPPTTLDGPDATGRALFVAVGSAPPTDPTATATVRASEYGRGPWDPGLLHGGAVCGLAAWAAERVAVADGAALVCARLTVEIQRSVPCDELVVTAALTKPGRRGRCVAVTIGHQERVVARATSQWLTPSPGLGRGSTSPPLRPNHAEDPGATDLIDYPRPGFNCDAAELRYVSGSHETPGPGTSWIRLTSPVVAGTPTSPFVMAATVADLAAAAAWERGPDDAAYINPDLTLQLNRPPQGEWLCIEAANHHAEAGVGFNLGSMSDDHGAIGVVLQSLVRSPTDL